MPDFDPILDKAKEWFKNSIVTGNIKAIAKCNDPRNLNINPFTVIYLARLFDSDISPQNIAKALVYPRILGTSISTSFGTNTQKFITEVLDGFASTTQGIDIEFIDSLDSGHKKFCQLKAGPQTINKDDVETIHHHFQGVRNLARTNNTRVAINDFVVGILYGEKTQISANYKKLEETYGYNILVGKDFWEHLTGDSSFYYKLIKAVSDVAMECDVGSELSDTVHELANTEEIQTLYRSIIES